VIPVLQTVKFALIITLAQVVLIHLTYLTTAVCKLAQVDIMLPMVYARLAHQDVLNALMHQLAGDVMQTYSYILMEDVILPVLFHTMVTPTPKLVLIVIQTVIHAEMEVHVLNAAKTTI